MKESTEFRILVVDDEPNVGMIFHRILGDEGYEVVSATTGEECLRAIASQTPDLVFMDIRMPGITGLETLRRLRQTHPLLPVIMMTAYQTIPSALESMKLGAYDYLVKPLEADRLKAIVKQSLEIRNMFQTAKPTGIDRVEQTFVNVETASDIIAESEEMKEVIQLVDKVSPTNLTVLILGESGTGKEVFARHIHKNSPRCDKPFVVVDCAALPESLIESELFGYEKGAFTGADSSKPGKFESANTGTLFLDEIGNLPATTQAKLLRFLQEPVVERLGGTKGPKAIDVRVLAATNLDLEKAVSEGRFREDLFHRLKVFQIILPPLRKRGGIEIERLVEHFTDSFSKQFNKPKPSLSPDAWNYLKNYRWPGNIRELQNAVRSAVLLANDTILPENLPVSIQSTKPPETAPVESNPAALKDVLKRIEKDHILTTLQRFDWNKKKAAEALDVDYKTLYNKMKEYDILSKPKK
ncbi:MAG TPA: sigma-54 dependent transcriptional regulator [Elusimicrobiota bacterium]|nr:sigma-54 dependent transcriptional regulator [Elusimicrobiota bacterium]